ncbi:hypothetical protein M2169_005382 [Streptomyces sp. MJP52]|nr:hypothetical protein [Streptomyces sp. MJP52]
MRGSGSGSGRDRKGSRSGAARTERATNAVAERPSGATAGQAAKARAGARAAAPGTGAGRRPAPWEGRSRRGEGRRDRGAGGAVGVVRPCGAGGAVVPVRWYGRSRRRGSTDRVAPGSRPPPRHPRERAARDHGSRLGGPQATRSLLSRCVPFRCFTGSRGRARTGMGALPSLRFIKPAGHSAVNSRHRTFGSRGTEGPCEVARFRHVAAGRGDVSRRGRGCGRREAPRPAPPRAARPTARQEPSRRAAGAAGTTACRHRVGSAPTRGGIVCRAWCGDGFRLAAGRAHKPTRRRRRGCGTTGAWAGSEDGRRPPHRSVMGDDAP